jgi:hypothetical protein
MPVTALPPNIDGCCPTACNSVTPLQPVITVTDTGECKAEPLGLLCYQGQAVDMKWVIRDINGEPVDLTGCQVSTVQFRMREIICRNNLTVDASCTINNKIPGGVTVTFPTDATSKPGVFEAQFGLSIDSGAGPLLRHINNGYIIIESSMFAEDNKYWGPPGVSDVLLSARMADPSRSDLLRDYEWSVAEIALAMAKPVELFNEALPPIGVEFTTSNFPIRFQWRDAIIGELMQSAGLGYLRDDMTYQSAGPGGAFADKAKWDQYLKIAQDKLERYRGFVLEHKVAYNIRNGYGFASTPYMHLWGS